MNLPVSFYPKISQAVGLKALKSICNGCPMLIPELDLIVFWCRGLECEYYLDSEPPLFRIVESDKEFTSFQQLTEEISFEP